MTVTAFDTETHLIQPGLLAPPLVCASFDRPDFDKPQLYGATADGKRGAMFTVQAALVNGNILVGHNIAYDLAVMANEFPELLPLIFKAYDEGRIKDTGIREMLIFNAQGRLEYDFINKQQARFSLAQLVFNHFGRRLAKGDDTWRLRYAELDGIDSREWPPEARRYALDDATWTLKVYEAQQRELHVGSAAVVQDGRVVNEDEQTRAAWWLHLMSAWGVRVDPVWAEKFLGELHAQRVIVETEMLRAGLFKAKPKGGYGKDMKALRAYVERCYKERGDEPPRTAKGAVGTNKVAMLGTEDPLLLRFAGETSVFSTLSKWERYLQAGINGGSINARFHVLKETGRTSASGPPVQQMNRKSDLRGCFIPRPGNVLVSADWTAAELYGLAQVLENLDLGSTLANALRGGMDPHLFMAGKLLNLSYDETVRRYKAGNAKVKNARQVSKAMNFGFPGGMGGASFVEFAKGYGIELTEERGKELKRIYMEAWPEMREYFRYVSSQIPYGTQAGIVVQHGSNRVRGGTRYTAFCNSLFQGIVADGGKAAGFLIAREMYCDKTSPLYGWRMYLFVHDEFVIEGPEDGLHEAAERLVQLMDQGLSQYIPDIPCPVEAAATRRFSKGADPTHKNGRLVVTEE